jgi:hypothetical protein
MRSAILDRLIRLLRAYQRKRREVFSARCQRIYDDLNADCFGGALPPCTVRVENWTFLLPLMARADPFINEIQIADLFVEDCDVEAKPEEIERTLLHEACHFRGGGFHGEEFQAELRRLATMARYDWVAAWVDEEVLRCVRQERAERKRRARAMDAARVKGRNKRKARR